MRFKVIVALWFTMLLFRVGTAIAEEGLLEEPVYFSASITHYFLEDEGDLNLPVAGISIGPVYFEARHNYEAEHATSLWLGTTFDFGEQLEGEVTPLIGGIFGSVEGMAPGIQLDLTYQDFNLYSEAEYVFDFDTRDNNFFYSWSELTYYPVDWLRIGVAGQRTRLYDSGVELDRGPLVGIEVGGFSLSTSVLNVDTDPIWVVTAEVTWGADKGDATLFPLRKRVASPLANYLTGSSNPLE